MPKGEKTGSVDEALWILWRAWEPIFNSYAWEDRPSWETFRDRYRPYIEKRSFPMKVGKVCPYKLRAKVTSWQDWKASGSSIFRQ